MTPESLSREGSPAPQEVALLQDQSQQQQENRSFGINGNGGASHIQMAGPGGVHQTLKLTAGGGLQLGPGQQLQLANGQQLQLATGQLVSTGQLQLQSHPAASTASFGVVPQGKVVMASPGPGGQPRLIVPAQHLAMLTGQGEKGRLVSLGEAARVVSLAPQPPATTLLTSRPKAVVTSQTPVLLQPAVR